MSLKGSFKSIAMVSVGSALFLFLFFLSIRVRCRCPFKQVPYCAPRWNLLTQRKLMETTYLLKYILRVHHWFWSRYYQKPHTKTTGMQFLRTQTSDFLSGRSLYETLWHRESSVKLRSVFPTLISAAIAFTLLVFLPSGWGLQPSKSWIRMQ